MSSIFNYIRNTGVLIIVLVALYLINPYSKDYLIGYILVPLVLIDRNFIKNNLDFDVLLLLLFSFSYALFYSFDADATQGRQYIFIYALTPPTFYLIGKYLARNNPTPTQLFYVLFTIGSIFSVSAVISVYLNFNEGGFAQLERSIPMIWDGNPVSATIMGGFMTLNMCIPALLIISQGKKNLIFNIIAIGLFLVSLICVLRLGSRTQLGIFLLSSVMAIIYIIPRQAFKKNIILVGILLGIILYIGRNVSFDLDAEWMTTFADRMSGGTDELASGGGRMEKWTKSLEYLFTHPLGWNKNDFGYSHNLWLDVLRATGIVPFLFLIIFSLRSVFKIKNTFSQNKANITFNAQILIYSLAFFLLFMVEPIFEGIFSFFVLFCLFQGIINKYGNNLQTS